MIAETNSSAIHYDVSGDGDALVLISGLGGLGAFWKPVVPLLAERFRVVTFDHPGVGKSPTRVGQTIPGIAEAVLAVMDREQIRTAHFVGHSTGSLVAQTLALDYAERCERLVLSGGWAQVDKRFRDLFAFRRFLLENCGAAAYNALSRIGGYDGRWYSDNLATDSAPDFSLAQEADVATIVKRLDMLLAYDRVADLPGLHKDVLVIGAADDFIVPFYNSEDLARLIPAAELKQLDGGHFFPQVHPKAFAMSVTSFLERK
ncbi:MULTISPECIES: alpha/beta hydrolase [unclassified Paraburkholderia]|uniref:alpha/beta fold hydrolase n=1 Tax=unclassified Paraburkholderia TaxID=2615204 RepID=UPI002AB19256|nr:MULTISPECIES: alpha/beta hydrolase [unclassified Paraburkholderia]